MWGRVRMPGVPEGTPGPSPESSTDSQEVPSRHRVIVLAPEKTRYAPTRSLMMFRLLLPEPSPIRVRSKD